MRRLLLGLLLSGSTLALGALVPSPAGALPSSSPSSPPVVAPPLPFAEPRVHPEAMALFTHRALTGGTLPFFRRNPTFEATGVLPVVVRFVAPPSPSRIEALIAAGVRFPRGARPTASGAYLARVTEAALALLTTDPDVARVSVDMVRAGPRPLDRSGVETRAALARRAVLARKGTALDGAGTVIADIDSPAYTFHPAFFRADGGVRAWVDVDRDEALTVGVDGVDLDGNGTVEPTEVLRALPSKAVARTGDAIDGAGSGAFRPDVDYLFLDTNGNGARDVGTGATDATPGHGEPIFVVDDADQDGKLAPSERLLQLGSSKFLRVRSRDVEYASGGKGAEPLVGYDPASDLDLAPQTGHATGVAGILVGGQPGVSRWLGLAPGAQLLLDDSTSSDGPSAGVQWAIDNGANVILTEYAPYAGVSLDGSGEDERLLDAANDQGVITVSPAGNLVGGKKHRTVTLTPGVVTSLALPTDGYFRGARALQMSLHHRGVARGITVTLELPDQQVLAIPDAFSNKPISTSLGLLYHYGQKTPRGTLERHVAISANSALPGGTYKLGLTLDADAPLEVDLYAGDDVASWMGGFAFDEESTARTMCNPSTSDRTLSVGAYVLHGDESYTPAGAEGDVASYSSRGPLLYGRPAAIELLAPDNPVSAAPPLRGSKSAVAFSPFGGTSGAGPHVAAAIALVRQALPGTPSEAVRKKLLDTARPQAGGAEMTGKGKLDVAAAADATVPTGAPPKVELLVVEPARVGGAGAQLRVQATDDEPLEGLTARWDLDYDGTFDTDWLPLGVQVVPVAERALGAVIGVKAEVRDGQGNLRGATMNLVVGEPAPVTAIAPGAPAEEESGCGCRVPGRGRALAGGGALALAVALAGVVFARRRG